MNKKNLYAIGCAVGGAFVGFFANQLNTIFGAVIFAVGVALVGFCIYRLTKVKKDN